MRLSFFRAVIIGLIGLAVYFIAHWTFSIALLVAYVIEYTIEPMVAPYVTMGKKVV
jgi:hypothetical protein